MPETISVSEFKATCLKVIDQVKKTGLSIVVTKRGVPYALLSKPPELQKQDTWIGKYEDVIKITGDIIAPATDETEWNAMK